MTRKSPSSILYLTEADYHLKDCLKGAKLRAYIVMQSLFFDQVVVGDTQFNNNKWLRALVSSDERKDSLPESVPSDLGLLIKGGHIVPALRENYSSLADLRAEHVNRGLKAIPSEAYAQHVSALSTDHYIRYRVERVSDIFTQRVQNALATPHSSLPSVSEETQLRVYKYVIEQEPLLFRALLDWMAAEVASGRMTKIEFDSLDVLIDHCYRHNIAAAIDSNIDFLIPGLEGHGRMGLPLGSRINRADRSSAVIQEISLKPYAFFSIDVLSLLPAGVVAVVKGTPRDSESPYHKFTRALEEFRMGRTWGTLDQLAAACELYCNEIDYVCQKYLRGEAREGYMGIRARAKRGAILRLIKDGATNLLEFVPYLGVPAKIWELIHVAFDSFKEIESAEERKDELLETFIMGRVSRTPLFAGFDKSTETLSKPKSVPDSESQST